MAPCMSEAIACNDFLQTSGKLPASFVIPPFWPPIPSAHVSPAFFLRIAFHIAQKPPEDLAFLSVYQIARQPPPEVSRFMMRAFYRITKELAWAQWLRSTWNKTGTAHRRWLRRPLSLLGGGFPLEQLLELRS